MQPGKLFYCELVRRLDELSPRQSEEGTRASLLRLFAFVARSDFEWRSDALFVRSMRRRAVGAGPELGVRLLGLIGLRSPYCLACTRLHVADAGWCREHLRMRRVLRFAAAIRLRRRLPFDPAERISELAFPSATCYPTPGRTQSRGGSPAGLTSGSGPWGRRTVTRRRTQSVPGRS